MISFDRGVLIICCIYFMSGYDDLKIENIRNIKYESNISSSIWCTSQSESIKQCVIQNVCYSPKYKTFLFYVTQNSTIIGIHPRQLNVIPTSSIQEHNNLYLNISTVKEQFVPAEASWYFKPSLVLSRFKPDNLMHVLHDDIFPLFLTLNEHCLGSQNCDFNVLYHDDYLISPFSKLYDTFSNHTLHLSNSSTNLCFKKLHVGLRTDSIFFQYGFNKPQGPVKSLIHGHHITQFKNLILSRFNIQCSFNSSQVIFLTRSKFRKILNEEEVESMISNVFENKKVEKVDSSSEIDVLLQKIACADVLIGMHGAGFILSIFMKQPMTIIELFPYAIRAEHVSFTKSFCRIKGVVCSYHNWHNLNIQRSIAHPEYPALLGGIEHLPQNEQLLILKAKTIPAVKCCHNPAYLHRMYQDTWVTDFEDVLQNVEQTSKVDSLGGNSEVFWLMPSSIYNLTINIDLSSEHQTELELNFKKPFNIPSNDSCRYKAVVEIDNSGYILKFNLEILSAKESIVMKELFSDYLYSDCKLRVWISVEWLLTKWESKVVFKECEFPNIGIRHRGRISC